MNKSSGPIRTLVVDDDKDMCQLVCRILTNHFGDSLSITSTNNGETAIGMIAANPFELCITDLDMPEINGFRILKLLKEDSVLSQVVFLTAHPDENAIKSAFSLGASDYLWKPIVPSELCDCIEFISKRIRRFKRDILSSNEITAAH